MCPRPNHLKVWINWYIKLQFSRPPLDARNLYIVALKRDGPLLEDVIRVDRGPPLLTQDFLRNAQDYQEMAHRMANLRNEWQEAAITFESWKKKIYAIESP